MKLKQLNILSPFRNLDGMELKFNPQTKTYVLIGKNGSGKSSLLEALSSIFKTLYSGGEYNFEFKFLLIYELDDGRKVKIVNSPKRHALFYINDRVVDLAVVKGALPQRVVCNYSGEEMRIDETYYKPLRIQYEERLKAASGGDPLRMVFVGKDLWETILCTMVAHRNRYVTFDAFLKSMPGSGMLERLEMDIDRRALEGWGDNPVSYYVHKLAERIQADGQIDIRNLNPNGDEAITMFNNLCGARAILRPRRIVFTGGADSAYLSEGEKKWMVVLFILEVLSSEDSLVLLDEPDSHIHVVRKNELAYLFQKTTNRENVITSHSPTMTAAFDEHNIVMLERTIEGSSRVVDAEKQKVVAELTNGMWSLQQQNIFLASNKDIVLVEGETDELFLTRALEVFHKNGRFLSHSYDFLPCGGAKAVGLLRNRFHPKEGQRIYCFLDADDAGWACINNIFERTKSNSFNSNNFGKARKNGHIWIAPYPNVNNKAKNFNIEDYFYRRVFRKFILSYNALDDVLGKDELKKKIRESCEKGEMSDKDFKRFAAVFRLIEEINKVDAKGKSLVNAKKDSTSDAVLCGML